MKANWSALRLAKIELSVSANFVRAELSPVAASRMLCASSDAILPAEVLTNRLTWRVNTALGQATERES